MNGSIYVEENVLHISDFSTTNREIIDYFNGIPDENRYNHLESMLLAGVTTFKTIGTTDKIDYIEKSFKQFHHVFDKKIEETLGEKGIFNDKIDETFGENGALVRQVLNPNRQGTPLFQLKTELKEIMNNIWKTLEEKKGKEKALENTTFKGYCFENVCENLLSDIVKNQEGDFLEKTTDLPGFLAPSKKGDFVANISDKPSSKIVFEIKDVGNMSVPEIHRILDESIDNRGADYGVIVFRFVESLPQCVGWFKEYYGNKLVIALGTKDHEEFLAKEIIQIAYMWAKTKVKQQETLVETENIIPFVQEKMKKITDSLKKFSTVRSRCTTLDNTVTDIRGLIDNIELEISDQLTELRNQVKKVIEEKNSKQV